MEKAPLGDSAEDPGREAAADPRSVPRAARRVLIVDDSQAVRRSLVEALQSMPAVGEIVEATDGVEALTLLGHTPVDLILSDVTMPRLDGFKFLSAVRNNPKYRDVMVIMISGLGESVDKVRGLTIGANDYITKPFERGELQARVSVMLKMKDLQDELQRKASALERANRELERLANQDGLTGLPNRRSLFALLEVEFHRAQRLLNPLSLLMLDIDHFKAFNDRFGHLAGDDVLRAVGSALAAGVRDYDCPGRYGGEEFLCFLPETEETEALVVAERLRERVAALKLALPLAPGEVPPGVTISVGIACWPATSADGLGQLIAAADRALYQAKARGRNCSVVSPRADNPRPPEPVLDSAPPLV